MANLNEAAEKLREARYGVIQKPTESKLKTKLRTATAPVKKAWRKFAYKEMTPEDMKATAKTFEKFKFLAVGSTQPLMIKSLPGGAAQIGKRIFKSRKEAGEVVAWVKQVRGNLAKDIRTARKGTAYLGESKRFAGVQGRIHDIVQNAWDRDWIKFTKSEMSDMFMGQGRGMKTGMVKKLAEFMKDLTGRTKVLERISR